MDKTKLYCLNCKKEMTHPMYADRCRHQKHELKWLPEFEEILSLKDGEL